MWDINNGSSHPRYSSDSHPNALYRDGKRPLLSNNDDPEKLQSKLRLYSASVFGTSVFFWLWAVYNTYHLRNGAGGLDLGMFSFFGTGVSSALLLRSAFGWKCCRGKKNVIKIEEDENYGTRRPNINTDRLIHTPPGQCLRAFTVLTQLTVVANYMLGILFAFTASPRIYVYFATYCIIFSLLWLVAAYAGWVLMRLYSEVVIRAFGENVKGPPSSLFQNAFLALTSLSEVRNGNDEDTEEDDVINEELRSLYEGSGTYSDN